MWSSSSGRWQSSSVICRNDSTQFGNDGSTVNLHYRLRPYHCRQDKEQRAVGEVKEGAGVGAAVLRLNPAKVPQRRGIEEEVQPRNVAQLQQTDTMDQNIAGINTICIKQHAVHDTGGASRCRL